MINVKRMCHLQQTVPNLRKMGNISLVLHTLIVSNGIYNLGNMFSDKLIFKISWGSTPPDPPRRLTSSVLDCVPQLSKACYSTVKQSWVPPFFIMSFGFPHDSQCIDKIWKKIYLADSFKGNDLNCSANRFVSQFSLPSHTFYKYIGWTLHNLKEFPANDQFLYSHKQSINSNRYY